MFWKKNPAGAKKIPFRTKLTFSIEEQCKKNTAEKITVSQLILVISVLNKPTTNVFFSLFEYVC